MDHAISADTVSVIGDPSFQYGLVLKRADKTSPGTLYPFVVTSELDPKWELVEWGSEFELSEEDKRGTDGEISYANPGKNHLI